MRELPQSDCGNNQEGTLLSCLHIYIYIYIYIIQNGAKTMFRFKLENLAFDTVNAFLIMNEENGLQPS